MDWYTQLDKSAAELLPDFDWDKVPGADIRIPEGLF